MSNIENMKKTLKNSNLIIYKMDYQFVRMEFIHLEILIHLKHIQMLCNKFGLHFDRYDLATVADESKTERIKKYLTEFPLVNDIIVYDDRDKEIRNYREFKDRLQIFGINFEIRLVDDGIISLIEGIVNTYSENNIDEGINLGKIRNFISSSKTDKGKIVANIFDKLKETKNQLARKYLITALILLSFDIDF